MSHARPRPTPRATRDHPDPARRELMRLGAAALAAPSLTACSRRESSPPSGDTPSATPAHVVVYSSADSHVARGIADAFQHATGIRVSLVGDTEATKTTGLAVRLESEAAAGRPGADVWWSSEVFSTIRLSRAGVLAPLDDAGDDPSLIRGSRSDWAGFALRARVLAYAARAAHDIAAVRSLADLAAPAWRARVGIARGPFGTTRGHLAALASVNAVHALESWLAALKENRARVYDGNAAVVRAIAAAEIDAGLTDTDDVLAANANNWNLSMIAPPLGLGPAGASVPSGLPLGSMAIPNSAARVRSGPNPEAAARFLRFLLSPQAEREIIRLSPGHEPLRPDPASASAATRPPGPPFERLDYERVEAAIPDAMNAWARVMD